jgi:putative NADPH-quinone reductase
LVYPTWWFNVPGTLKGFLDRTFLPHVAFRLPKNMLEGDTGPTETGLQPLLTNIGRVGVVSTYGASAGVVFGAGDNGRRMWSQGLRPLFAPGCCLRWDALYEMDMTTPAQRADFLAQVEHTHRNF